MNNFYDDKECLPADEREQGLFSNLPAQLAYAKVNCPYYQDLLAGFDVAEINSRALLSQLPVTRKSHLIKLQQKNRPFAGMTVESNRIGRLFQSPGPINEPEGMSDDWWRMGRAFYAAGFRKGDIAHNCLSYHMTPGGFIMDSGAKACGCGVIPAGPGQTEQQLEVLEAFRPDGYCGTPSFLNILLDKAKAQGRDISFLNKALVTGEPFPDCLRQEIKGKGVSALQAYATADIGLIAYESQGSEGMIVGEDLIVEIVRPGSGQPVKPGEIGEILVTNFNKEYPLIRFATGDLSAVMPGESPCGRTNMRIKGWLGRADQTVKIKGMFVHPEQVEKVRSAFHELVKARLVVSRENHNDQMMLKCELNVAEYSEMELVALASNVRETLKAVTKLSGQVEFMPVSAMPDDGKVINDTRSFE